MSLMKRSTLCLVYVGLWAASATATTVFFDDFEDGSATDGNPVRWIRGLNTIVVEDGKMVVSANDGYASAAVMGLNLTNTSLRSQFRIRQGTVAGVAVRYRTDPPAGFRGYYGYTLPSIDEVGIGWTGDVGSVFDFADFEMDATDEIVMQLDAIQNDIHLWVWTPGEPMPSEPLAGGTDNRAAIGDIFVYVGGEGFSGPAIAEFEYVHVATASIPEPASFALAFAAGLLALRAVRRR